MFASNNRGARDPSPLLGAKNIYHALGGVLGGVGSGRFRSLTFPSPSVRPHFLLVLPGPLTYYGLAFNESQIRTLLPLVRLL